MEFAVFKAFPEARPAMGTLSLPVNPTRWLKVEMAQTVDGEPRGRNYHPPRESESPFDSDNDTVFDR
jgi:hypothetical protein